VFALPSRRGPQLRRENVVDLYVSPFSSLPSA